VKEFSELYITRCVTAGVLTKEKIRKYPLRSANLAIVLKAYAVVTYSPYTLSNDYDLLEDHKLYLTDDGLVWLIEVFKTHSLTYLKSTFRFVFSNANFKDISDINYIGYNNFRGITGDKLKAGSKQPAVIVHKNKEYKFDTLHEARKEILMMSRFYPIDEFTLYRIRKNTKNGKTYHYRNKVRTILPPTQRGVESNLPHLRR